MPTNFHLAPPPRTVDGLLAVPIDIQSIDAAIVFNAATSSATADATITFIVGPTAGNPIFDLRQTITAAWLDGAVFPASQLAHHSFGAGAFDTLRVIESVLPAGSYHTLRVQYNLALPASQLGGSYLPALNWTAGPSLRWAFGFSDLNAARYLEAWLPANLIFDQFSINMEVRITNTLVPHAPITNGVITVLGTNHWRLNFPAHFSALSPMLEIWATSAVEVRTDSYTLPVSGIILAIEAWKQVGGVANLVNEINRIKTFLGDNENSYGSYAHGNRYVAFFNGGGGMEYEGSTTTSTGALNHEMFHSWFARGIKPSSQSDGWWDEGFTTWHDNGANDALPFDFSNPPVLLCSRNPWQRITPSNAYSDGNNFFAGMAAILGVANFNAQMRDLYNTYRRNPVSTQMMEEFLLKNSGNAQIVDAFHRFVYGFADTSPAPDLWLRDAIGHTGTDAWGGAFWDSPDLWVRNQDDGITTHQPPEFGQDNWFYARVRNRAGAGQAQHFVVTFHARGFAGTEFIYPNDFFPSIAATAGFDLSPGGTQIVKARWPRGLVPPAGSHTCLLASVISRSDHPTANRHVWEHNNLAQKNLTVVDMAPDAFILIPMVISNLFGRRGSGFELEAIVPQKTKDLTFSIVHTSKAFFQYAKVDVKPFLPKVSKATVFGDDAQLLLDCGGHTHDDAYSSTRLGQIMTSANPELMRRRFPDSWEADFGQYENVKLPIELPPFSQNVIGLKIAVLPEAKRSKSIKVHFVQRNTETKEIVGGIAVQINLK